MLFYTCTLNFAIHYDLLYNQPGKVHWYTSEMQNLISSLTSQVTEAHIDVFSVLRLSHYCL